MSITQIRPAVTTGKYIPKGTNVLNTIFKNHFKDFTLNYEEKYEKKYGTFRLDRISSFVDNYKTCGDYSKGIARIQCVNSECKHEIYRPFSCKKFYFCPSCSQKRAILFGEYISNEVMLKITHRQYVFSFPKMLRPFFRNNKKIFSDISRLIYKLIVSYYKEFADNKLQTGVIISFQTFGDFLRYNPHFHTLVLEGCFDKAGNFIQIPIYNTTRMTEYFRQLVIKYFVDNNYITESQGRNLLSWRHSGFSIDNSVKLFGSDNKAREALGQYIARCPVSLQKLIYEPFKGKVIFKTKYNNYFKENLKVFEADDFIAELTQHVPQLRARLIRYYGLYSSKMRGRWKELDYIIKLAPNGWREQNDVNSSVDKYNTEERNIIDEVIGKKTGNKSWARLIKKIYQVDPMICPECGSDLKVLAIITDRYEVNKILKHLVKTGKSPPGFDENQLN